MGEPLAAESVRAPSRRRSSWWPPDVVLVWPVAGAAMSIAVNHILPLALMVATATLLVVRRLRARDSNLTVVLDAIADRQWDLARSLARRSDVQGLVGAVESTIDQGEIRERALLEAIHRERIKTLDLELYSAELGDAKVRLEQANRDLEAFTYSASHDLGAPLRTIEAFAALTLEQNELSDEARSFVESIGETAGRMLALIRDLLVVSGLKAPDVTEVRLVALADIVGEIAADIRSEMPTKARLVVDGLLPSAEVPPERVRQVLQNLIRNGFKFNRSSEPIVTIDGWSEGDMTIVRVTDNGIGIPGHDHEQVFGLFSRLHAASQFEGTGAGLAIARRAARSLGGDLWIESSSPEGTTFACAFPTRYRPDLPASGL